MSACDLLQHLRSAGLSLAALPGGLSVTPRGRLTDDMREAIRQNKADLLALLTGPARPPSQAPYWPNTEHLNDREIDTFEARLMLFTRRGMSDTEAEALADKLVIRDRVRGEWASCFECQHLTRRNTCGNHHAAQVPQQLSGDLMAMTQNCTEFKRAITLASKP